MASSPSSSLVPYRLNQFAEVASINELASVTLVNSRSNRTVIIWLNLMGRIGHHLPCIMYFRPIPCSVPQPHLILQLFQLPFQPISVRIIQHHRRKA